MSFGPSGKSIVANGSRLNECCIDPAKLTSVLHYDGTPITERFITREIGEKARFYNVTPLTGRRPGVRNGKAA